MYGVPFLFIVCCWLLRSVISVAACYMYTVHQGTVVPLNMRRGCSKRFDRESTVMCSFWVPYPQ
ncbi:hypothetical protein PR003_g6949 [Phytophthora rubi]|uniref:Secreted protein n=1 Tax=Phytophthora rubi TaxID=129364 RepID=A0A6A3NHB7_9STRA|nr:hypothetical protein PR002_g6938 [Phytophthora rubi]KAE9041568.1 hypothetical protein PR001_g6550 [Phytophthora rubi]KAE9347403.1 hypothetical protein PR003_g6949 [Phytophthora rubi]